MTFPLRGPSRARRRGRLLYREEHDKGHVSGFELRQHGSSTSALILSCLALTFSLFSFSRGDEQDEQQASIIREDQDAIPDHPATPGHKPVDLDWQEVQETLLEYFPLDGTKPKKFLSGGGEDDEEEEDDADLMFDAPSTRTTSADGSSHQASTSSTSAKGSDTTENTPRHPPKSKDTTKSLQSLYGRSQYRDFYIWYQQQPHLFVSYQTHSNPLAVLALQAFIMYTSNDSERCIQIREHSAMVDLISIPFAHVVRNSKWPIFGMLHEIQQQLRSTSGFPLYNFCDSLDADFSDKFLHQLNVFLAESGRETPVIGLETWSNAKRHEEEEKEARKGSGPLAAPAFTGASKDDENVDLHAKERKASLTKLGKMLQALKNRLAHYRKRLRDEPGTTSTSAKPTSRSVERAVDEQPARTTTEVELHQELVESITANLRLLENIHNHSFLLHPKKPYVSPKLRLSKLAIFRYMANSIEPPGINQNAAAEADGDAAADSSRSGSTNSNNAALFWEKNWWHLGKCPFGKASAAFALALAAESIEELEELLQEGQKHLMNYNLKDSLYDLISTKWPVWKLLHLIQKRVWTARKIEGIRKDIANDFRKLDAALDEKNSAARSRDGRRNHEHPADSRDSRASASASDLGEQEDVHQVVTSFALTLRPALTRADHPESVFHEAPISPYFPYFKGWGEPRDLTIVVVFFPTLDKSGQEVELRKAQVLADKIRQYHVRTVLMSISFGSTKNIGSSTSSRSTASGSKSPPYQIEFISEADSDFYQLDRDSPVLCLFSGAVSSEVVGGEFLQHKGPDTTTRTAIDAAEEQSSHQQRDAVPVDDPHDPGWTEDFLGIAVSTALQQLLEEKSVSVVGFPILADYETGLKAERAKAGTSADGDSEAAEAVANQSGSYGAAVSPPQRYYLWEPRKIRDLHNTLQYLPYPTGYAKTSGKLCFQSEGGHSAARVFRSGGLFLNTVEKAVQLVAITTADDGVGVGDKHKMLLDSADRNSDSRKSRLQATGAPWANLAVALDVVLKSSGTPQHLCFNKPARERVSYLQVADLRIREAVYYAKENQRLDCREYERAALAAVEAVVGRDEHDIVEDVAEVLDKAQDDERRVTPGEEQHLLLRTKNRKPLSSTKPSFWCFQRVLQVLLGGLTESGGRTAAEKTQHLPGLLVGHPGYFHEQKQDRFSTGAAPPPAANLEGLYLSRSISVYVYQRKSRGKKLSQQPHDHPDKSEAQRTTASTTSAADNRLQLRLSPHQSITVVPHSSAIVQRRFDGAVMVKLRFKQPSSLDEASTGIRKKADDRRHENLGSRPGEPAVLSVRWLAVDDQAQSGDARGRNEIVAREDSSQRIKFHFLVCGRTDWLHEELVPSGISVSFFDEESCAAGMREYARDHATDHDLSDGGKKNTYIVLVFSRFLFDHRWRFAEMESHVRKTVESLQQDGGRDGMVNSSGARHAGRTNRTATRSATGRKGDRAAEDPNEDPATSFPSSKVDAIFYPAVNSDGERVETCRQLRVQYWKALYYTSTFSNSRARRKSCAAGSAFRVYTAELYRQLANNVPDATIISAAGGSGSSSSADTPTLASEQAGSESTRILLYLDLLLNDITTRMFPVNVHYASTQLVPEDVLYSDYPVLDGTLADQFQIEVIAVHKNSDDGDQLLLHSEDETAGRSTTQASAASSTSSNYRSPAPGTNIRKSQHCMPGLNWFQINTRGVIGSYCFREQIENHFRYFLDWWVRERGKQAVPEEGSLLALWRNGAVGQFPWDSDFDLKLYTDEVSSASLNRTKEQFNELLQQKFSYERTALNDASRTTQAWSFLGCGDDNYFLIRIPNITHHIGDVYYQHSIKTENHPWRARMLGMERYAISLSQHHMEHIFFDRYHAPVEKLFGDHGSVLQCLTDHNACLPDCKRAGGTSGCEFEDNFVHVNVWDLPEQEPAFWPSTLYL
ncbi:unnamed protein product [Amoebophrya sp. A120]|nr:unnamed protein product [Amoebophrya sp. A120]|eukprot:GSA120T00009007001.1